MAYDFDRVIDRRNTYSLKYDLAARGLPGDTLPLWVADMDFQSPPCVLKALAEQNEHGVFGYYYPGDQYFAILQRWFLRRFDWNIEQSWLVRMPGVINAIHLAILTLTEAGCGVIIQQPVYHLFATAVRETGRRLVVSELVNDNGCYRIDFEDFERKILENNVKAFILCNPHNPVGRVWTRGELARLGDICLRHGVIVIADEIHQDFVYQGHRHLVFAGLDPGYGDITVTCTAPTKTFNLAGLPSANIFISNARLRKKFRKACVRFGLHQLGVMEVAACQAAYEDGEQWLHELLHYLTGNMALIRDFLAARLPEVKLSEPEGTYLAWLDFWALGLNPAELDALILQKAGLWLHNGGAFGAGGVGFMRLNAACPRSVLQEALERLEQAVHS